jgi:centromeric protein E
MSYLEIYNENVNDLLCPEKKNLEIRDNKNRKGSVMVDGISKFEVKNIEEFKNYLLIGEQNRKIGATKMNDKSSRSHTVVRIEILICQKNTQTGRNVVTSSEINLVDLAGSEGVGKTHEQGIR